MFKKFCFIFTLHKSFYTELCILSAAVGPKNGVIPVCLFTIRCFSISRFSMESREAFERRGEKHGIFVESLRRHLAKPKRVNFMLTDVQDDVQRSCLQVN